MSNGIAFESTPSSIIILLDTFFNVQYNEHIKAWKWRKFCKDIYGVVL
jgi:hypothetical protein